MAIERWIVLFFLTGATSLIYETVWLRRLSVVVGGSATAAALTLGVFMAGLALGALLAPRRSARPAWTWAALEAGAAVLALLFPWTLDHVDAWTRGLGPARPWLAAACLLPPSTLLGATWAAVAPSLGPGRAAALYAANTSGAVVGVLAATFVLLPEMGVRGTEILAAVLALGGAGVALVPVRGSTWEEPAPASGVSIGLSPSILVAAATCGLVALGLEVVWMRLASVALGASVQTFGVVLAVFLATVAAGAWIGERWPRRPEDGLRIGLSWLAVLAVGGAAAWGLLPYAVAGILGSVGPDGLPLGSAALAAIAMGGAPAASGLAFAAAVRALGPDLPGGAGRLYTANTLGSLVGATLGGLWMLPVLEPRATTLILALAASGAAVVLGARPWALVVVGLAALCLPAWDARLFAVGVHLRAHEFANTSPAAVRRFADEGWELLLYDHGPTGAVAVGRSTRTGNVWLSVNGKVDASTGADMPTQRLSGEIPVQASRSPERVLIVGLASGVTAGAVLEDSRVKRLTIAEIEPAIVAASRHFDHVNGRPLDDPRTSLVVDDARALLQRDGPPWDVIISEPSNPWITGVSSLFTREYWLAARRRLAPGGVFCQWVQLYGLGPEELRGLVRTFTDVFGDTWLVETIPGSDVLLVAVEEWPPGLQVQPRLSPSQVRRLGGEGWLNTDDHPRVEWGAPRWLYRDTSARNEALIQRAEAAAD